VRRVAFVSQPWDVVVPPRFSSVGLVTARLAAELAAAGDDVVVHGRHPSQGRPGHGGPVRWRLSAGSKVDAAVQRAWPRVAAAVGTARGGLRPPLSTTPWSAPRYLGAVAREVAASRPDVVHVQQAVGYLPRLRRAAPEAALVLHLHSDWFPQTPVASLRRWTQDVDAVLCVSTHVRARVAALLPELQERLHLVPNGVDAVAASGPHGPSSPPSPAAIVYVGAIAPHRGLHVAVRAFELLADRFPDAVLRLVGPLGNYPREEVFDLGDPVVRAAVRRLYDGDYAAGLLRGVAAEVAARVELTGALPYAQTLAQLAGAAVFVFPTICSEGFGLPVIEAMAAGVPVVASRVGGVTDLVVEGETGLLVDTGDAGALAQAVGLLLADAGKRRARGEAGRRRAEAFRWPLVASSVRSVHEAALQRRAPGGGREELRAVAGGKP
jgi:glycosyltransferase involved in cell wall biosynthesis